LKIAEIIQEIELLAPLCYQEDYDNCGLLAGDSQNDCTGALLSLDCTEEVVQEAIDRSCNLIISHHPLIFKPLKRISASQPVGRTLSLAIKNNIAIYACHTNLDNVWGGVNSRLADKLGLTGKRALSPKTGHLCKLVTFVPPTHIDAVRSALFEAGAGHIGNYDSCSFSSPGEGTFKGDDSTKPFLGKPGILSHEQEIRLEIVFEIALEGKVIKVLKAAHPYEEPAFDIYVLRNSYPRIGSGLVGDFAIPMHGPAFLEHIKKVLGIPCLRHSNLIDREIKTVAICGGSGSFLISNALSLNVDALVTGDIKYHDFFEADGRLLLVDAGHYETEQFTPEIYHEEISRKFSTFAVHFSKINTNPVNYL
jgi:dinuclear metal center YbgI/SA1388 family protein